MDTNNGGKNRNVYRTVKEENLFFFFLNTFFPLPTVRIYQVELLDTSLHNVSVT